MTIPRTPDDFGSPLHERISPREAELAREVTGLRNEIVEQKKITWESEKAREITLLQAKVVEYERRFQDSQLNPFVLPVRTSGGGKTVLAQETAIDDSEIIELERRLTATREILKRKRRVEKELELAETA
jgi:hypothetical protein